MKYTYNFPAPKPDPTKPKLTNIKITPGAQQRLNRVAGSRVRSVSNIIRYWIEMDKLAGKELPE